jgi:hypothetical protein
VNSAAANTVNERSLASDTGKAGFSRAVDVLSYVILAGGFLTALYSSYIVVVSYSSLPFWDGWVEIDFPATGGGSVLEWLWTQHNEHRLLLSRLFMLADLHWFHARQTLLLVTIFVILCLQAAALAWSMRAVGGWRGALWRTGVGLAAFCLLCPSLWEMLVWGECVCFALPGLFAILAIVGLMLYWTRSQDELTKAGATKFLILSVAAALGGSWSLLNGNLLWPLLFCAALLLRLRRAALAYVIAGALSIALYLYDYISPSYALNSARTPVSTAAYLATYFGSTWVNDNFRLAVIFGLVGLAACFWLVVQLREYVRNLQAFHVQLILIMLFCAGTGFITAFGRSGFGLLQAATSRYQAFALLFWCCLGLLLLTSVGLRHTGREAATLAIQVAILCIMLGAALFARNPLIRARVHGFKLHTAEAALITGVPDIENLKWVYRQPDYLYSLVPYMRREQLSVFHDPISQLLDKPLATAFQLAPASDCTGALESSVAMNHAMPPMLRITGWAWDVKQQAPAAAIVAASDGMITGVGAMGDWRILDKATHPWMKTNFIGYTGYVQAARPMGPVEIYAILKGTPATACLIATVK